MNIFICEFNGGHAVVSAYNRGHAIKLLSKKLEKLGLELKKSDKITKFDAENKKGTVYILKMPGLSLDLVIGSSEDANKK